jgi:hypothetical protein
MIVPPFHYRGPGRRVAGLRRFPLSNHQTTIISSPRLMLKFWSLKFLLPAVPLHGKNRER